MDSPQSWNRYSYVGNNPIRNNDPTGHCADPATATACLFLAPAGPPGWVVIGILLVASVTFSVVGTNYLMEEWQLHDPHTNDREAMQDSFGQTADGGPLWSGRGGKTKGCLSSVGMAIACLATGIAGVAAGHELANCLAGDSEICKDDPQPGKLIVSSPTPTAMPTATPFPPSFGNMNNVPGGTTIDPTIQYQLNQLTPTATPKPSPMPTYIRPTPIRTNKAIME